MGSGQSVRGATRWSLMAVAVVCAQACGQSLPLVPTRSPPDAWLEVPYPPPPARAEFLPAQPSEDARWVDGAWSWASGRWVWAPGRWVLVPPGVVYAPWGLVRSPEGRLFLAPASWRDARGRRVQEPRALATATPVPG